MAKQYQPAETRLLAEYLAARYSHALVMERVRLGTISPRVQGVVLTDAEIRALGTARRWADAVIVEPDLLTVVEASIIPGPGKISQLQVYFQLVAHTPELQPYVGRPQRGLLLWAVDDPVSRRVAAAAGLLVDLYHPDWVDVYLAAKQPRYRQAPRA
jgi:hypothetical protein